MRSAWDMFSGLSFFRTPELTEREARLERWWAFSGRVGWVLYTLVCFGFFVFLTFPTDVLLQRLVVSTTRTLPLRLRYAEGTVTWRGVCVLRDVTVERAARGLGTLRFAHLTVQPSLWGVLFNRPLPLGFRAELYGGTVAGTVRREPSGICVQFSGRQLALEHWPLPAPLSQGRLRGSVTVDGDLRGNFTDPFSLQGTLTLAITDGAISAGVLGGFPLPAVQSVQTHLRAVLVPGRLEIAELKLNTDGIDTTLKGTITLRTPFARSELALQLTTKTTGSPPPALNALISFLPAVPGMPGEHRALLTGTLVTPVIR